MQAAEVNGLTRVDAAYWPLGNSTLVSVINKNYVDSPAANLSITLPSAATGVSQVAWGTGWSISSGFLTKVGIEALEVDLFII